MSKDRVLLEVNSKYLRKGEVPFLKGNFKKIEEHLGWKPSINWRDLAEEMVEFDCNLI